MQPGDQHAQADDRVIVVLGGAVDSAGRLAVRVQLRLDEALRHYRAGYAARVIVSGKGPRLASGQPAAPLTEAEAMSRYLAERGLPPAAIVKEEESADTAGNLYFTRVRFLDPAGWRRPLIVTSSFHVARVKVIADWVLGDGYAARFAASPDGPMSEAERARRAESESRLLREFLETIRLQAAPGDLPAIGRALCL